MVCITPKSEVMWEIRSSPCHTEHLMCDLLKAQCSEEIVEGKYSRETCQMGDRPDLLVPSQPPRLEIH